MPITLNISIYSNFPSKEISEKVNKVNDWEKREHTNEDLTFQFKCWGD